MSAPEWPADRSVRVARGILRHAARLVPFARRTAWHREWEAELWAHARAGRTGTIRFALGGLAHAWSERHVEEGGTWDALGQDVRLAVRRIRRTPGFALVIVAVLGLGIGANTALFSALDAALLASPPYPEVERLVLVDLLLQSAAGVEADTMSWSYPKFEMGRDAFATVGRLAGYSPSTVSLTGAGAPARIGVEYVTPGYFPLLGVRPATGRLIDAAEEVPAEAPIALLSHALWVERFGADPGAVGRTITLNGAAVQVVGVVEPGFRGVTGAAEAWVPVAGMAAVSGRRPETRAWAHWLHGVGRLAPGATLEQARAEADAIGRAITEAYPDPSGNGAHGIALVPYLDARVNTVARTSVAAVAAAALFFLVIACASVAGLLLARAAARGTDAAVRTALGARRIRLVREQLVESLLLAGVGGGVGVALALAGERVVRVAVTQVLDTAGTRGLQYLDPEAIAVGPRTLAIGFGAALLTGLVFGLPPALSSARAGTSRALRRATGLGSSGGGRDRARSALVAGQLSMTLVLLIGAGVLASSFARLARIDPGFDRTAVLDLRYDRGPGRTEEDPHLFLSSVLEALASLPGVEAVAAGTCPPLAGRCEIAGLRQVDDEPPKDYDEMTGVLAYTVSDAYFETLGVELLGGRSFEPSDRDAPPVVVVNETAARELFGAQSALGHELAITHSLTESERATIVGVVGDVRYAALEDDPMPAVYLSERQVSMPYGTLFVRTASEPASLVPAVRAAVAELDPGLPLYAVSSLDDRLSAATARTRVILGLLAAFGFSGLLIGALGLYGAVAHTVSRRTSEVGLRIALGADRGSVVRMLMGRPAAIGTGAAIIGVVVSSQLVGYLDGVVLDGAAFPIGVLAAATALLLGVACLAAWIPARRATRIPATEALRAD